MLKLSRNKPIYVKSNYVITYIRKQLIYMCPLESPMEFVIVLFLVLKVFLLIFLLFTIHKPGVFNSKNFLIYFSNLFKTCL